MSRVGRALPWLFGIAAAAAVAPAQAQSNLDAGKSPAQIFADTCNACHRSPREIKKTTPAFLREHYTTGLREATAMAAYLANVGSDPRAVQQRRPPAMGAGQTPAPETHPPTAPATAEQTKPETQAALPTAAPAAVGEQPGSASREARPRRPSESMESPLPATGPALEASSSQPTTMPAQRRYVGQDIEE